MGILPICEPTEDVWIPCAERILPAASSWSSSRSSTFVFHALRNSMYSMPKPFRVWHWDCRSGLISSAKPERIHMATPDSLHGSDRGSLSRRCHETPGELACGQTHR